jgi:glycosyltransferase involved in cell wall biosynthesis
MMASAPTARRRPRVLYLAFYFPPTRASGVYRAVATANCFAERGWDVTVATAPREFFAEQLGSSDPSLETVIHPEVRVERIPLASHLPWERELRRIGPFQRWTPTLANDAVAWLRRTAVDETYALWVPGVVARAVKLHARRRFDLVVATGNPFAAFYAAWLTGRLLRIPYVLDYRDAWTLELFSEKPGRPADDPVWRLEERILRGAAEAVFVNEPLRRWHQARYPFAAERMTVVPNGWDPQILAPASEHPAARDEDTPVRFGYLGTITDQLPLEEFFAGWELARRHPVMADARLDLYGHLGFFPHHAERLSARMPLGRDGVEYRGPVAKAEVAAAYAGMDALVFLAGGARYVTSGKIFEYMATGRPVVSAHRPGIAAADVLAGYPLWFGGDGLDPAALSRALIGAAEAARKNDPDTAAAARAHAARYTREAALAPFEQRMRSLVHAH